MPAAAAPVLLLSALVLLSSLHWAVSVLAVCVLAGVAVLYARMTRSSRGPFLYHALLASLCSLFVVYSLVSTPLDVCVALVAWLLQFGLTVQLHTMDPGVVRRSDADPSLPLSAPQCPACELPRPPRSKHCRLCAQCVHDFDHHCVVLDACIGRRNHRLFVLLLLLATANGTRAVHTFYEALPRHVGALRNVCVFALGHALVLTLGTCFLLLTQCWQIGLGLTTNERLNQAHERYAYVQGRKATTVAQFCRNALRFCAPSSAPRPLRRR
jgi:hypothetical protein